MRKTASLIVEHGKGYRYHLNVPKALQSILGRRWFTAYLGRIGEPAALEAAAALAVEHRKIMRAAERLAVGDKATLASAGGVPGLARHLEAARWLGNAMAHRAALSYSPDSAADVGDVDGSYDPDGADAGKQALAHLDAVQTRDASKATAEAHRKLLAKVTPANGADPWQRLVGLWARGIRNEQAKRRMRRYVAKFVAHCGCTHPRDVTAAHARSFRDELEKDTDVNADGQQHCLSTLQRLLSVGKSEGLVTGDNPFAGVKVRKAPTKFAEKKGRGEFSPAQLKMILSKAATIGGDFELVTKALAYHGARSGEICQMRGDDVMRVDGVLCMSIHDLTGSVKNTHSVRVVPIHGACAAAIEKLAKERQGGWLFRRYGRPNYAGNFYQQEASKFLRGVCGIIDPKLTCHSLRHSWTTTARAVSMPDAVEKRIQGHVIARNDQHARYGSVDVKTMQKWLRKIVID